MAAQPNCQCYLEQKNGAPSPIHPLIMAAEFLSIPPANTHRQDWQHLNRLAEQHRWASAIDWRLLVKNTATALVVTDCQERIVWVNRSFVTMIGYSPTQVKGRNPNFLQGKGTDPVIKRQLRQHIEQRLVYSGTLLNYRRDGQPYWCQVRIEPLYNQTGELVHFIAIEDEVIP